MRVGRLQRSKRAPATTSEFAAHRCHWSGSKAAEA